MHRFVDENLKNSTMNTLGTIERKAWEVKDTKTTIFWFNIIITIICSIGCIWHIYDISEVYFSFPTTTSVEIVKPEMYELPSVTFCLRLHQLFSRRKLKERLSRDSINVDELMDLPINKINELNYDSTELIADCNIRILDEDISCRN